MVYPSRNQQQSPPEHWNSYRPNYDDNAAHQGPPTRPSVGFEEQIRNAPAFPRGRGPSTTATTRDYANPNRITLTARRRSTPSHTSPDTDVDAEETNTNRRLWPTSLDTLMGRTSRAYDLVINYVRDSRGGTRWDTDGIERVYIAGKFLHDDVRVLRHWKHQVAEHGGADDDMMGKIEEDVKNVRSLCEEVQRIIGETERKGDWEGECAFHENEYHGDVEMYEKGNGQEHEESRHGHEAEQYFSADRDRDGNQLRPQRRQRSGEGDSYRPYREGNAGRLGHHILHY
jgi:hypothetical protein